MRGGIGDMPMDRVAADAACANACVESIPQSVRTAAWKARACKSFGVTVDGNGTSFSGKEFTKSSSVDSASCQCCCIVVVVAALRGGCSGAACRLLMLLLLLLLLLMLLLLMLLLVAVGKGPSKDLAAKVKAAGSAVGVAAGGARSDDGAVFPTTSEEGSKESPANGWFTAAAAWAVE